MLALSLLSAAVLAGADTGTSTEYLDRYREIMALAPLRDSVADVEHVVIRRDTAEITLSQGTLYLLSPVGGRTVGVIFRGAGRFSLNPPHPTERESLRRSLDVESINDSITEVVLLFADSMPSQLRSLSFHATSAELPGDLRGHVHDLVESLQGEKEGSFDPDVLGPLLNGESTGFFLAYLRRDRKSTRLNSSHTVISYAVFCLKK